MTALPADWRWSTIADVGRVDLGRQRHPDWHTGPNMHPYLRVANVFEDRIDTSDLKEMDFTGVFDRYRLEPGDVLLNEGQTPELLGRPAIYRGHPVAVAFTNSLLRFRAGPAVTPEWALTVFRHHMHSGRFARESRITTNIAHLSAARFKTVEFPIPPLGEQRRIVEILEDHLSRLDAGDSMLGTARARLDRLVVSVLARHFHSMQEQGVRSRAIGDLAETALGKMLDAKKLNGDATAYLANINVRWGRFDLDHLRTVPLTNEERKKFELRPGDILACEGGEPGRCAVWQLEQSNIAFQKALHRIRIRDDGVEPQFLALMLQEGIQSHRWDHLFTGTTIKHLPQEKLRRITVPVPSKAAQLSLISQVGYLQEQVARAIQAATGAATRGIALRKAVLAAACSGKLSGSHTDHEVIEELADIPSNLSEAMVTA